MVSWKSIEPAIFDSLSDLHFHLWSVLIVFEFIKGGFGLGSMLRTAILFKDLAGLFAFILIVSVLILAGTSVIKYFKKNIFYWSIK